MNLATLIAEFAQKHQRWSTQAGAEYQCDTASDIFIQFAKERGIEAKRFEFTLGQECNPDRATFRYGSNEAGHVRADWHCIVDVEGFLIDWTARQYVETAPFPYIIPQMAALAAKAGAQ
jgi:hypothetical protein